MKDVTQKRITIFTVESFPSFAGTGLNALYFAQHISGLSKQVTLCHLNYNNNLPLKNRSDGVDILRIGYCNKNFLTKCLSLPRLFYHYFWQVRASDIIFVYSGYLIAFQFILWTGNLLKKKVIFRSSLLGGDDAESLLAKKGIIRKINRFCLRRVSFYFAINSEFTRRWESVFGDRVPWFESLQGVNEKRFSPPASPAEKINLRKELGMGKKEFIILSAGYVLRKKGYGEIFEALSQAEIPFRYYILGEYSPSPWHHLEKGEPTEMKELVALGKALLGSRVVFKGAVTEIEKYYKAADIFLHGATVEGTPNVLLEAMSSGLTCIIRNLPGVSEDILTGQNSIKYEDSLHLPIAVRDLFQNPGKREKIGNRARKTITDNYTFEKVAKQWFDIL